jgi:hypothetical protein
VTNKNDDDYDDDDDDEIIFFKVLYKCILPILLEIVKELV